MNEELLVEGKRAPALRDPTAAATVIPAERYAGEAKDVAALLATAPGVAVQEYGGLGQLATVSIRGSTVQGVSVLLDGLPLSSAWGGVDLATIPSRWIERIDVVRGASGALFGAGAMGGALDIRTVPAGKAGWSAEAAAGSFGTWSASVDAGRALGEGSLLLLAGAEGTSGRYGYLFAEQAALHDSPLASRVRENARAVRAGSLAKLSLPVASAHLDALVELSAGRRGLPGSVYFLTPGDRQEDGRLLASARLSGLAAGFDASVRLHLRADWLRLTLQNIALEPLAQRSLAGGLALEASHAHGPGTLDLSLSSEGEGLAGTSFGPARRRANLAASAAGVLRLLGGDLTLAAAARVERVGAFSGASAKVGTQARLLGPLSLRVNGGRTFRAPSFAELWLEQGPIRPNPDLRSEAALSADAALAVEGASGLLRLGGFTSLYDNLIVYKEVTFGRLSPFNSGRAVASGLEAEASLAPVRPLLGLSLAASYTLLATEILRGEEQEFGKPIPFRPRHGLYARAGLRPGPVELHVELHHVSSQTRDAYAARRIPAATIWSCGASLELLRAPALSVHLETRNLLDDRTLLDPLGNPLPGRMAMISLRSGSPRKEAP